MPSLQAKITKTILQIQPYGWAKGTVTDQRSRQEKIVRFVKLPKEIQTQAFQINDISAEWFSCSPVVDGVILYLHGGAFSLGSINVHREYLARLALATRVKVLAINYHLAPEYPFPTALEDSLRVYHWLLVQGYASSRIVIAGDSAGGGLALSTIISIRDAGETLPACAVCISPWVDMTLSAKFNTTTEKKDPILNISLLENFAKSYAGEIERNLPLVSPVCADLKGLPPLLIHVGTDEILLDQAIQFAENAKMSGVEVTLKIWEGLFHVFQMFAFLPETQRSFEHIAGFIASKFGTSQNY